MKRPDRWTDDGIMQDARSLIAFGAVFALGFGTLTLPDFSGFDSLGPLEIAIGIIACLVWISPFIPLVLGLACHVGLTSSPAARTTLRVLALVPIPVAVLVGFLVLVVGAAGALLFLVHVTVVCIGVRVGLLWAAEIVPRQPLGPWLWRRALLASAFSALSLLGAFVVVGQSIVIADGRPFCVARHDTESAVGSLGAVRLFSFYTTRTGYKSTSRWWFHGVLTVEGAAGERYSNWSPRLFRFDRIERPYVQLNSVTELCEPSTSFWREVVLGR